MKEIHLICNAHIDPIWQWDWQEGVSATLSTFQSAVNLAKDFDYIFCHNEVTVYKYAEEYAPKLFNEIKALVKAGKWHIMGGWYLQPDCNMPSGESFVRQIQEGKRYFMEKFGTYPATAINFDPFGHSVGLVQIIKKCGQDGYMFMRPHPYEMPLDEEVFIWRGLDGSEIKAARTGQYNSPLGEAEKAIRERANSKKGDVRVVLWGVGNHGGGPSRKDLTDITRMMNEDSEFKFVHSTPDEFFKKVNPTYTVEKSLHLAMPGCYSSDYRIKKKHAMLESELYLTEMMLSTAYARGLLEEYPEEKIHSITQNLLEAEFHDVLPGTVIQSGEANGIRLLEHGLLEAEMLKTKAYFALSSEEDVAGEGEYPIFVFNPNAFDTAVNVECEFMLAEQNWRRDINSKITVKDSKGREIPFQLIKEESNLNLDWRKRIIFEANLKSLGFERYSVYVTYEEKTVTERDENLIFDNGHKRVEIDGKTGLMKSFSLDGKEYVRDGFRLVSLSDNADPWGMSRAQRQKIGTDMRAFSLSEKPSGVFEGMKSVQVVENGDILLGIEAFFEQDNTRARVYYKIYKNNDYVDVEVTLYLCDINRIIKLELPIGSEGKLVGQCPFGYDTLFTDGRENVSGRFVAMIKDGYATVLMNEATYGSHFENGALYTSLLRGATYCAHPIEDRELIPADRFTKKIDQGENVFSFRFGAIPEEKLERETQAFSAKPYALNIFPTPKTHTRKCEFDVTVEGSSVTVKTIKKADGREAIIFRLLNNTDAAVGTVFSVDGARLPLCFGKFEAKTVIYENGELSESYEMII